MDPSGQIHVLDTDETFVCKGEESVLRAMERCGRKGIPSGCRNGGCGVCKVRILSGEYHCKKMSRAHVSELEEGDGYALACKCFPEGDITLEVIGQMKKRGFTPEPEQ